MESVILNSPILLFLFALTVALALFNAVKKQSSALVILTGVVSVVLLLIAMFLGASLQELLVAVLLFALINFVGFVQRDTNGI
ncbi:MAG: hypothetical protein IJD18_04790 [Clostridia bacterium]|nr:hypothetical protein [Clostridia bacterium]MBQ3067329.1 hypothetical protein [Clostridia bacterium]